MTGVANVHFISDVFRYLQLLGSKIFRRPFPPQVWFYNIWVWL